MQERIKNTLKSKGMSQVELSERTGYSTVYISDLLRGIKGGESTKIGVIKNIAKALDVSVGFLMGENDLSTDRGCNDFLSIPVYDVRASAGYGIEPLKDEDIIEMRLLSRSFLPRKNGEYHIIFVDGDSMTPTLKPNEPVLIDASIKNIASSGIYVLRINDGIFIKRLDRRPDGTVVVISDNKAYGDFVINDGTALNIIGKAVLNFQML